MKMPLVQNKYKEVSHYPDLLDTATLTHVASVSAPRLSAQLICAAAACRKTSRRETESKEGSSRMIRDTQTDKQTTD